MSSGKGFPDFVDCSIAASRRLRETFRKSVKTIQIRRHFLQCLGAKLGQLAQGIGLNVFQNALGIDRHAANRSGRNG